MNLNFLMKANLKFFQLPAKINWNWQRYIRSIIGTNEFKPLIHFDTGGGNFDRFIVSERRNDNPMLGWIISKFNRRGQTYIIMF